VVCKNLPGVSVSCLLPVIHEFADCFSKSSLYSFSSSPPNNPSKATKVFGSCKFFTQGRCTKGTACPFPHVVAPSAIEYHKNYEGVNLFDRTKNYPLGPCKFFIRGVCSKGSACPFPHPSQTPLADLNMTRIPCVFYSKGICKKGDSCTFSHDCHEPVSSSTNDILENPRTVSAPFYVWVSR
jgi:Zinc finger domain/RNA-binding, Nab2-type zinc finger